MNFVRLEKDFQFYFQTISNIVARQTVSIRMRLIVMQMRGKGSFYNDFLLIKPLLPPKNKT